MKIVSREYKAMLDHGRFADRKGAAEQFWLEFQEIAATSGLARTKGNFGKRDKRSITFLDTPDLTLGRHGLVFRQRTQGNSVQYTLKCRSDDRYFAAGSDLRAAKGLEAETKLEEDIAAPFRCRFSHSTTVTRPEEDSPAIETIGNVSALFPALAGLQVNGQVCPANTPMRAVHNVSACERVFTGAKLFFEQHSKDEQREASVALILWSNGEKGRSIAAEFSFRIKDSQERFGRALACSARTLFARAQRMDWCRPDAATKTQLVYGGAAGE